ncbi:SLC26A/SulP transporter family protein [candidate division KSB1 bacterium]
MRIRYLKKSSFQNIAGDISGGISSAIIAIPGNIAFGIIAFAPLGGEYISNGIMAGFYSSIFVGLFSSLFGGTPAMISGPKAPVSLIFSSVLIYFLESVKIDHSNPEFISVVLVCAFFTVLLSGFLQIIFGIFRLGNIVKFIPYPVIAGFLNGTALLIVAGQIWSFFGISKKGSILNSIQSLNEVQPLTLLIGISTVVLMLLSNKVIKKVHPSIIALIGGSIIYYIFLHMGFSQNIGHTLGNIQSKIPSPVYFFSFLKIFNDSRIVEYLPYIITASISIAVLGSTDTLLTSLSMKSLVNIKPRANRELAAQGLGNMFSACFGGIAGAGYIARSMVNYNAGGRTRLSGIVNSISILLIIVFFSKLISMIPMVVIAAVILVIAFQIFDKWTIQLFKSIVFRKTSHKIELLDDFLVIIIVMLVTAFFNLIAGVAVGILISVFFFVSKMSKSVIRRDYRCSRIRSRKKRNEKLMCLLEKYGDKIAVLELEGHIFFGSADNLTSEINKLIENGVSYLILDMKRVTEIDSSGARVLEHSYNRLKKNGKSICFSYLPEDGHIRTFLKDLGVFNYVDEQIYYPDTDQVLEVYENLLLCEITDKSSDTEEILLKDFSVLEDLTKEQFNIFTSFLQPVQYGKEEVIFAQGDRGDSMFLLAKGSVDITINIPGSSRKKRLLTLSAGTFFGEMALLDGKPRSANIEAKELVKCYRLEMEAYKKLKEAYPDILLLLLSNITKTIVNRLRDADNLIAELES